MDDRLRVSRKQERDGMRRYNGKQHGGSGSGWSRRHDGHTKDVLFEFKTVLGGKKQITIKLTDLLSVQKTALSEGRLPVLQIEIAQQRWVCIPDDDFMELWDAQDKQRHS